MLRFMLHTPVNVRGRMLGYIKASLKQLEEEVGDTIKLFTPHDPEYSSDCTEEWLVPSIEKDIMPDVIVTHATEFAALNKEERSFLFSDLAGQYMELKSPRKEFDKLKDPLSVFYPISVTPLAMIYNTQNVNQDELQHSWQDLFNEKYRIVFPDRDKPLSRAVGGFLKSNFPDEFPKFEQRVTYRGTPANMPKLVASGEYDMAMTLLSFAQIDQQGKVKINKTKEGYIPLPQLLVWKQGADKKLIAFADLLTGEKMQSYLAEQDTWAAQDKTPMCSNAQEMKQLAEWKGWDVYLKAVADFDQYIIKKRR